MPQASTLALKNSAGTSSDFAPVSIKDGVTEFAFSNGVALADQRVTVSATKTAAGRRKVMVKLTLPVVQDATVDGVTLPKLVRTAYAELTLSFDPASTETERKDTVARINSLLGDSANDWIDPVISGLASIY